MGISRKEALDYFASDDLIGIGMEADAIRRGMHPEGVVTYSMEGRLNCGGLPQDSVEQVSSKIARFVSEGGTGVTLHEPAMQRDGSHHSLDWFQTLFGAIKRSFPDLWLHGLSASEILILAAQSNFSVEQTLHLLREAGLDSIAGDDAGILDESLQPPIGNRSCSAQDWITVHRAAHRLGLQTTASMIFGAGETAEHRVNHLQILRRLQNDDPGFICFVPWTHARSESAPGFEEATAVEYLKTLAISRMVLDNIGNVESSLQSQGLKVVQVGLRFGANDAGSVLLDNKETAATEEQVRQVIRDAGFTPVQRDAPYRTMFLN